MRLRHACVIPMLACTLVAFPAVPSLAQKPGQTFESPLKNFTVPVPKLGLLGGTQVQKKNGKNDGTVSFIGDTGDSSRIDYMRLPPGSALTGDEQQSGYERMLKGLVDDNANSVIIVKKPYIIDDVPMLFAVVSFPGGSHLMNQQTRKHFDSTRGLLFFVRNGFVYVLHDELTDGALGLGKEPPSAEELTRRAERSLPAFYRSITFK